MMISNEISGLWSVIFLISTFNYISAQMNWSSWSRYSACSVSCGQGRQRRQRQCIKTSPTETGTCRGPKEMYAPCQMLACPKKKVLPCNCGCTLNAKTGQIMSQLPSKETKSCEWRITAEKGSTIALNITRLILKAGWVRIASGKKTFLTLLKPGPEPNYPWKFKSEGNVMTVELLSYPDATGASNRNTYLAARYEQIGEKLVRRPVQKRSRKNSDKEPNVPAIIGITACVAIIILVAVFMAVRRHHRKQNAKEESDDDGNDVVNLSSDYDSQGKPHSNGSKEGKPLMEGKSSPSLSRPDRFMAQHQQQQQQQQMMTRPTFIQGRDSAYDSAHNPHQNIQANGIRLPNYPPDFYMKTPNYIPDPNFYRMMPVTTTGVMYSSPPQQQPFVMHAPLSARSDHS